MTSHHLQSLYCCGLICQYYSRRSPKALLSRSAKTHRLVLSTSQTGVITASTSLIQGVQLSICQNSSELVFVPLLEHDKCYGRYWGGITKLQVLPSEWRPAFKSMAMAAFVLVTSLIVAQMFHSLALWGPLWYASTFLDSVRDMHSTWSWANTYSYCTSIAWSAECELGHGSLIAS